MPRIQKTATTAGKEARAYAEVSADGGEEVHDVHGLIPGLVVHHSQGGERTAVRRPEVPLVVAEHSLYVLITRVCFHDSWVNKQPSKSHKFGAVLQIRDVYPVSRIPDPTFKIPDPDPDPH
jgi:hypothetical protein